jgi:hypothetical protein
MLKSCTTRTVTKGYFSKGQRATVKINGRNFTGRGLHNWIKTEVCPAERGYVAIPMRGQTIPLKPAVVRNARRKRH